MRTEEIIADAAHTALCVVTPEDTLRSVIETMALSAEPLAFVMAGGDLRGVVSEGDIIRAIHDGADLDEVWAADVMTANLVRVESHTAAWDVLEAMLSENIRHVIVDRDDGEPALVGFPDVVRLVLPD